MDLKQHPTRPDVWVTPDGRVFIEPTPSRDILGYHHIRCGELRERRHVLVCETYKGPRPKGMHVRHMDGNPGNDAAENLEWGTPKQNYGDQVRHKTDARGQRNAMAMLTLAQAQEIYDRRSAGESGKSLAAQLGVTQAAVCDLFKGRTWPEVRRSA